MKVAIDISQMHPLSRNRGIGVYVKNLYASLKKFTELDVELIEEKAGYKKFDLIHYPFFDLFNHTLRINSEKPFVVTVHDLIPIMFPKHYPPGIKGRINWHLQKYALNKVKSIISVSNTVKNDLQKLLNINPTKIKVVYSAPSESFRKISDNDALLSVKNKYNLPDKFVLYVGNVNWNKNILNSTEAVLSANKNLVIIGSAFLDKTNLNHPEKKSFKIWLKKYGGDERIRVLEFIRTEEIVCVMNLAKCLIFVSFYEGFGLPILEAQACGLPVITSKISATAEIAGKGAILVNPENPKEISNEVENIFHGEKLREQLLYEGMENVKRFSWKETALKTVKVYEDALNSQD